MEIPESSSQPTAPPPPAEAVKPKPKRKSKPKPTRKSMDLAELQKIVPYGDEEAAFKYLEGIIWHLGYPVCPYCMEFHVKPRVDRKLWKNTKIEDLPPAVKKRFHFYNCRKCGKDFTVRSCTVMERSHIPLYKWVYAAYYMIISKKGVSSLWLSEHLGITARSARILQNRIRVACGHRTGAKLPASVEVDEAYIGGKNKFRHTNKRIKGRGSKGKIAVVGMRDREGNIRAEVVDATDKDTLQTFIKRHANPMFVVYTDEHKSYVGIDDFFKDHRTVQHGDGQYVDGDKHTNGIESVWAAIRGCVRTHHRISKKHLQRYIDEEVFRLNNRNKDTAEVMRLLFWGARGKQLTYDMNKKGKGTNGSPHPQYRVNVKFRVKYKRINVDYLTEMPEELKPFVSDEPPITTP